MPCLQVLPEFLAETRYPNPTNSSYRAFQEVHRTGLSVVCVATEQAKTPRRSTRVARRELGRPEHSPRCIPLRDGTVFAC